MPKMVDVEDQVKEAERQLSNKDNYRKTNCDPTTANKKTIHYYTKTIISRFQKKKYP